MDTDQFCIWKATPIQKWLKPDLFLVDCCSGPHWKVNEDIKLTMSRTEFNLSERPFTTAHNSFSWGPLEKRITNHCWKKS